MSVEIERVPVTKSVNAYSNPRCDKCGVPLERVFDDGEPDTSRQYTDALTVDLSGGYACYIDLHAFRVDLCGDCSPLLFAFLNIPDPNNPENWEKP